jgi:cellulose synthase/poly-beta-1,6-N-acetylglucosamine synthase-like glycosyltransferase
MATLTESLVVFALVVPPLFLLYFLLYHSYTLTLIALAARQVRRRVAGRFVEDLDLIDGSDITQPLTIIQPTFNEEATIVERVTSLVHCDYPRLEVVVVNDGSSDGTLAQLKRAFQLRRTGLPYRPAIGTARVRATYEASVPLPDRVMRMIVIDKENGGKADALNAGINASMTPYFVALDADSILDQRALKELMRAVRKDTRVVAVAGQVAIANGCGVQGGRIVSVALPDRSLPRFQMVEYLRSFTIVRTGLDRLGAVLIQSRTLAAFEKDTMIRAGGYLTPFVNHRITGEYVRDRVGAVCENMEIIIRLHRFVLDKLHHRRIVFLPHPVAWTEVPETFASLRKQRGRWYRGLRESLRYHRAMMWRPEYGRIGWFAMPAFWLFEYYGPLLEIAGYLCVLFLLFMQWTLEYPLISEAYLWAFLLLSLGYGILVNILAILLGAWRFRLGVADRLQGQLLPYKRRGAVLVLLAYAVLENLGYRQLTLFWRLRGLVHG